MIGRDLTVRALERALSAASLRQQVIANNIANLNTPGFKRSRVEFESLLAEALAKGEDPSQVRPKVVQETNSIGRPDGNNVALELEMTELAETQIWHAALVRQMSDHFGRMRQVIYEGRR